MRLSSRFLRRLYQALVRLCGGALLCFLSASGHAQDGDKLLYINSYHPGYQWSDGITQGIESRLLVEDLWYKIHHMDTKRNRSPEQITAAALEVKNLIENMQPDVVIISDDNAAKYVLGPYYKDSSLPFVYCGINWDASIYGLPYKNTTGMLEISFVKSLIDLLSGYAKGDRIGFLSIDALSEHRKLNHYQKLLKREFDQAHFVNTVAEWELKFIELQKTVDLMVLENPDGIEGWEKDSALVFIQKNALIPIGSSHEWLAPYSLITLAKIPQEQGWWAAEQAVKILEGKSPSDIAETRNSQGKLFANMAMAHRLGFTLSSEILQTATLIGR